MPSRHTRRDVLRATGTTLAVTLAGCTAPGGYSGAAQGARELPPAALRMAAIDDAALPTKVLYTVGLEHEGSRAELLDDVIDGGTTVERTDPPLPEDRHIYYDDAVYELSREVIERTPATRYQVRVDIVQGTVVESEAVRFDDLPAVDREKFAAYGWDDGGTFGFGTTMLYTHAEREESALVPDSAYDYIVWADGSEAAWFVDGAAETTLYTYAYEAERYATAAEYGRRMREQTAFELAGLPAAEAAIVQTAIEAGSYTVDPDRTPTPAFWALAERFRGQRHARSLDEAPRGEGDPGGRYLVEYEDAVYWTVVSIRTERSPSNPPA